MSKRFLVEVVVCEYDEDEDGQRWTARGRVVGEFDTKDKAEAMAGRLVMMATPTNIRDKS